jgi:hypothetical protein
LAWEQAANQLLQEDPALTRLEPAFVREVASWRSRPKPLVKKGSRPAPARTAPATGSGRSSTQGAGWIAWVVIMVVVGIVRVISSTASRHEDRVPRFNPPDIHVPEFKRPPAPDWEGLHDGEARRKWEQRMGRPLTDQEWQRHRLLPPPRDPAIPDDEPPP